MNSSHEMLQPELRTNDHRERTRPVHDLGAVYDFIGHHEDTHTYGSIDEAARDLLEVIMPNEVAAYAGSPDVQLQVARDIAHAEFVRKSSLDNTEANLPSSKSDAPGLLPQISDKTGVESVTSIVKRTKYFVTTTPLNPRADGVTQGTETLTTKAL